MTISPLRDHRHALYVGFIVGRAMTQGVFLLPVQDGGEATDTLRLYLQGSGPLGHVDLIVPYPPEDWTFQPGPDVSAAP